MNELLCSTQYFEANCCAETIFNTLDPLSKFYGKADEGFLVAYSEINLTVVQVSKNILMQIKQGREMFNNMYFFPYVLLVSKILRTVILILPLKLRSLRLQFMFLQGVMKRHRNMMTRLQERLKERVLVNVASTPITTIGQNSTNITHTFSAAGPFNTTVSPTLRKSSYVDPSQYPYDPDMPALEDITYSNDEEDVGE
nr:hypothetical protein [Tanacetum cinerariifolium]